MATPLIITYFGPPEAKLPVKVMPMAPLRTAFEDACKRFKLDPSAHTLALPAGPARRAPAPVDLDLAFRLLPNVPSGARLEVVPKEGAKAAAAAAAPAAAARPAAAPAAAAATATATAAAAAPAGGGEAAAAEAAGPSAAAAAAPAAPDAPAPRGPLASLGVRFPVHIFHRRALEAQADAQEAAAKAAAAAAAEAAAAPEAAATTTEAAGAGAGAGAGAPAAKDAQMQDMQDEEEDDAFYQFTAEDWALAQRAAEKRRREQEGAHLTTQAQRDAAAKKRAEAYGPVPVRLHYPDGFIAQAEFAATDTLFSVWELAARLASAELAGVGGGGGAVAAAAGGGGGSGVAIVAGGGGGGGNNKKTKNDDDSLPLYLYTAPPKAVIKDLSVTLYQAGLVPAANLHVGSSAPSAQAHPPPASLRAEARALASDEIPAVRLQRPRGGGGEEGKGKGKAPATTAAALGPGRGGAMGLLAAGVGGRGDGAGGGAGGGGGGGKPGVPKWLQARK